MQEPLKMSCKEFVESARKCFPNINYDSWPVVVIVVIIINDLIK